MRRNWIAPVVLTVIATTACYDLGLVERVDAGGGGDTGGS